MANHPYTEQYYAGSCDTGHQGVAYDRSVPHWLKFFHSVAGDIACQLAPRTSFEIGCAKGFLVESLRDIGVEAEGIDISEYAISQIREDIKPFCKAASVDEFTPSRARYDMVISIEVIEHLPPELGRQAIKRMCELSDTVLISSSSDDFDEPTHINVQPNDYWRNIFAENGFKEDSRLNFKLSISKDTMLFRREQNWSEAWHEIQRRKLGSAAFYRGIPHHARAVARGLLTRLNILRISRFIKRNGLFALPAAALNKLREKAAYTRYTEQTRLTLPELSAQRASTFASAPKISIVTPVFNTPAELLKETIESVLSQTYPNWELCIADGSTSNWSGRATLAKYAAIEPRIKIKTMPENLGIAGNSNAALELAAGDYIGMLDHDDLLAPNALYEIVQAINNQPDADILYSDEDKISANGKTRFGPHFKPDWSPNTFRSYNYLCHFAVIKKPLLESVGRFRQGFDGAQDYDLFLRAAEKARRIHHIPKVLYSWRMTSNSTAANESAKPYAFVSGKKALTEHLKRLGLEGTVTQGYAQGIYNISYTPAAAKTAVFIRAGQPVDTYIADLINATETPDCEFFLLAERNGPARTIANRELRVIRPEDISTLATKAEMFIFSDSGLLPRQPDWPARLCAQALCPSTGAASCAVYGSKTQLSNCGWMINSNGVPHPLAKNFSANQSGYMCRAHITQNVSAVSGVLATRRDIFMSVKGFSPQLSGALADIDYCLKTRAMGKFTVWTPFARFDGPARQAAFSASELELFRATWLGALKNGDPCYNPNLSPEGDFTIARR